MTAVGSLTSFTANTKALSAEVNSNFDLLRDAITDGASDLSFAQISLGFSAKSANYTVLDNDGIFAVLMTTGGTDRAVTLPTAADNSGRLLAFKKVDSGTGTLTVDGEGAETIDSVATIILNSQNDAIILLCDGTEWHIIKNSIQSRFETGALSGDVTTTTGVLAGMSFANLIVGRIYKINWVFSLEGVGGGGQCIIDLEHTTTKIFQAVNVRPPSGSTNTDQRGSWAGSAIFTATGTSTRFNAVTFGSGTLKATDSYCHIEELRNYIVTTGF